MAGQFIEHLPHEKCGSSDALAVYEEDGNYHGYCFRCETIVSDPYHDKPEGYTPTISSKTPEQVQAEIEFVGRLPCVDVDKRKLRKESLDHFGVKVGLSESDGVTPTVRYFPYHLKDGLIGGYKAKLCAEKRMWWIGSSKDVLPFGWLEALQSGAKTLFITEGEDDAVALLQALKDNAKGGKWEHLVPAVISLKTGAKGVRRDLADLAGDIRSNFGEVVLVFDQDDAGQAAVREALDILPNARVAGTLPAKDANECILKGYVKGLVSAVLFKAEKPKNTRLIDLVDYFAQGRVQPEFGVPWPWEGMTKLTRGLRFGETYYFGAGVKMGKSELVNTLAAHLVVDQNLPICLMKPEEATPWTARHIAGKVAGRIFTDPNKTFDYEAYDKAVAQIKPGFIRCVDIYQDIKWEYARHEIIVAAALGTRAVFIDPITHLTTGLSASEANTHLQEIAQGLSVLAKDLGLMIFMFCHLKAPESGPDHEHGGKVYSSQFSGSRAMMRSCNAMFGLEGNKDPDLAVEERNMRKLIILEDRAYGATGYISLYWDENTGLFNEVKI